MIIDKMCALKNLTSQEKAVVEYILDNPKDLLAVSYTHLDVYKRQQVINQKIETYAYEVMSYEKAGFLLKLIVHEKPSSAIIFCETQERVNEVYDMLYKNGISAVSYTHLDVYKRQFCFYVLFKNHLYNFDCHSNGFIEYALSIYSFSNDFILSLIHI